MGRSNELSKFIKLNYLLLKERAESASVAESYRPKPASPPLLRPSMTHHLAEIGYDLWFGLNKRQWTAEALMGEGEAKAQSEVPHLPLTPGSKTVTASGDWRGRCCQDSFS